MNNVRRKGFTLIELLIVVVIIGILAAIAIPKFGSTKESAEIAKFKSDLRSLATAQETFYATSGSYGTALTDISTLFTPSAGVTIDLAAGSATGVQWVATASSSRSPKATETECTISIGPGTGAATDTLLNTPICAVP